MLGRIERARVLFIGEGHTEDSDHLLQLAVIRHLHSRGKRVVVAFEVFPAAQQGVLSRWSGRLLDDSSFERLTGLFWSDFVYYYDDILGFCRDAGIPLFGIGTDKAITVSIASQGPAVISQEQSRELRFADCSADEVYARLMKSMAAADAHGRDFPYFCEAQRYVDSVMALHLAGLLRRGESTVVVLAGAAHAARAALPSLLSRHRAVDSVVLLPARFLEMLQGTAGGNIADYLWY